MLVLSRKAGETFVIDKNIFITILKNNEGITRISIDAPRATQVDRLEIHRMKEKGSTRTL